jgi:hypothetical protein
MQLLNGKAELLSGETRICQKKIALSGVIKN